MASSHRMRRAPLLFLLLIGKAVSQSHSRPQHQSIELVSWHPRVFLHRKLLASSEAHSLASETQRSIHKGHNILPNPSSRFLASEASLGSSRSNASNELSSRSARWVQLPERLGEPLSAVFFSTGGYQTEHTDYIDPTLKGLERNGGQRLVTVLTELQSPPSGGDLVLTKTTSLDSASAASSSGTTACTRNRNAVSLQPGDALAVCTRLYCLLHR